MSEKKYEGWNNYETWAVKLWLDNEQMYYTDYRDEAQRLINEETPHIESELAGWLKDYVDEYLMLNAPESGLAADLLHAALGEVDWYEIAESILEDVKADLQREAA